MSTLNDAVDWSIDLGGGTRVALIQAGTFKTDVGAALGPVPWVIWQRIVREDIDADNRIRQALNCLLVETPTGRVLVETGIGERMTEDTRRIRVVEGEPILPSLRRTGFDPESVSFVVLSHLHYDHAGGLLAVDGKPAFPNAGIIVQRAEWEVALMDNLRLSASYDQPELRLVRDLAMATAAEGEVELLHGVSVFPTGGHTAGHQGVLVRGANRTLAFFGDLAMRPWSLTPRWTPSFDDFPLDSVAMKQRLFARAVEERWVVALSHERAKPVGMVEAAKDRFRFVPL